jgi:ornithine cyclodeaminase
MGEAPRIVGSDAIREIATPDLVIQAVRQALIDHARGTVASPPPGHLSSTDPPADCHIKFGRAQNSVVFEIKVATSFYDNPRGGLASSDGLMLVLSVETGAPLALLAAAGALAVETCTPKEKTAKSRGSIS